MKIVDVEVVHVAIPFRMTFRHALASRDSTDSIIVRVRDEDGSVGYGESAPREYVSDETSESARRAIEERFTPAWIGAAFASFEEVVGALRDVQKSLRRNEHAAFCALELSLLDLAGRLFHCSIGEIVGPLTRREATYSGVISSDDVEHVIELCRACREMGLTEVKLKVGRSLEADLAAVKAARNVLGDRCSLRVDANGVWSAAEALERIEAFAPWRIDGVEQPVRANDLAAMAHVADRSPIPVIADESLVSYEDAIALIESHACHVFDIRVSKNGGLIGACRLRDAARERHGLDWMLGAQVGETAILSAAGRQLATRADAPRWCEGSYGTLLLSEDIAVEDVTFGPGGKAESLGGDGLGITIDENALEVSHVQARTTAGRHDGSRSGSTL